MSPEIQLELDRIETRAVATLARLGVKFGDPVTPNDRGCRSCTWHVVNKTEDREDGGLASSILFWIKEGYLGLPENCVLRPIAETSISDE